MEIGFENILISFFLFALSGWIIELLYRSVQSKKITNPGFLRGPYLPIYGFGGLIAYFSFSYLSDFSLIASFIIFLVIVGVIEYLTGIFFKKIFKLRLWDYSDRRFNLNGFVCPTFLFYWLILGLFFKYSIFPYFNYLMRELVVGSLFIFVLGVTYGILLVDTVQSFDLAYKIRLMVNEFGENYISDKILVLKNLHAEVSRKLNEKTINGKVSQLKEKSLQTVNYFRLTRRIGEVAREVIKERVSEEVD